MNRFVLVQQIIFLFSNIYVEIVLLFKIKNSLIVIIYYRLYFLNPAFNEI